MNDKWKTTAQRLSGELYPVLKALILVCFILPLVFWGSRFVPQAEVAKAQHEIRMTERKVLNTVSQLSNEVVDYGVQIKTATGIDVSHFQGNINWQMVVKQPVHFAIVKATGGETYTDPQFQKNWYSLREVNLIRGAYHFYYALDDANAQAQHYLQTVGKIKTTDLAPVLDVEITDNANPQQLLEGVLTWLQIVETATKKRPIVYSDLAFAERYLNDARLSQYPLWIADYNSKLPAIPTPWKKSSWTIWQHSQKGSVPGIKGHVDLNRFQGSPADLTTFIQQSNL